MGYKVKRADANCPEELFEALSQLDRQCVGAEGWSARSFRSEAEKADGFVLYITDESGNLAALLSGYHAIGEGDITSVAVAPEHRRKGLALMLIEEFVRMLPDDTESVFLEVRESNVPAISLYEKCGFLRLSVRKNFYAAPAENAVVMARSINTEV